jgi:hypothetical protein
MARESGPADACFFGVVEMPFDPREHEKAKELCLLTLLEKAQADEKAGLPGLSCLEEMEIAQLSGLDNEMLEGRFARRHEDR